MNGTSKTRKQGQIINLDRNFHQNTANTTSKHTTKDSPVSSPKVVVAFGVGLLLVMFSSSLSQTEVIDGMFPQVHNDVFSRFSSWASTLITPKSN